MCLIGPEEKTTTANCGEENSFDLTYRRPTAKHNRPSDGIWKSQKQWNCTFYNSHLSATD